MDGVNIVKTSEIIVGYMPGINGYIICLGAITLICLAFSLLMLYIGSLKSNKENGSALGITIAGLLFLIIPITIGFSTIECYKKATPIYGNQYTVVVDDGVDFNEFMSEYEIVSIDGKLYDVIEKED